MSLAPTLFDHLLAAVLVGILPWEGLRAWRRLNIALDGDEAAARVRTYRRAILKLWGLAGILLVGWLTLGRGLPELGLASPSGWTSWAILGGAGLLSAFQFGQVRALRDHPEALDGVRDQLQRLRPMLPSTVRERRWFSGLGVTAGITEELLFRGFLLAYLASFVGVWPAVFLSSVAFGMGHLYQGGPGSVLKTGTIGLVLAILYVASGQLWAPILLHAVVDVSSGWAAFLASGAETAPVEGAAS